MRVIGSSARNEKEKKERRKRTVMSAGVRTLTVDRQTIKISAVKAHQASAGELFTDETSALNPADRPLSGLSVVEWSDDIGAQWCGRLLALLGADVVTVDVRSHSAWTALAEPRLSTGTSALWQFLNVDKRALRVDDAAGNKVAEAVASADVFVTDQPLAVQRAAGLEPARLVARLSHLVGVALSTFGSSGGLAMQPACDLTGSAAAGIAWGIGSPGQEPLTLPHSQCSYQLGLHGATAALAAVAWRERSGCGQVVDVSLHDVIASYVATLVPLYDFYGVRYVRAGHRPPGSLGRYPAVLLPCRDGLYCLVARNGREWKGLMTVLGEPAWAENPRYRDPVSMGTKYPDEVDALVVPDLLTRTKAELFDACSQLGVPSMPVRDVAELVDDPQFGARGFFLDYSDLDDRAEVRFPGLPFLLSAFPGTGRNRPSAPRFEASTTRDR
jgi:formyl-CoA transferase